jgi:TraM recognition site of TraD and TraG
MSTTQNPLPTWASPKRLQITADEVTQICPVPLPLWMADSAGKGILIVAVCHGLAQLEARWGTKPEHAPSGTPPASRSSSAASATPTPSTASPGSAARSPCAPTAAPEPKTDAVPAPATTSTYACCLPNCCGPCPKWRALILRTNLSPVIVRLRMAWRRRDYHRARRISPAPRRAISTDDHPPRQLPGPATGSETVPDNGPGPGSLPRWLNPPDPPAPPPPAGEDPPRRPHRPWDPPANDGDDR